MLGINFQRLCGLKLVHRNKMGFTHLALLVMCLFRFHSAVQGQALTTVGSCLDYIGNGMSCAQLPAICFSQFAQTVCRRSCKFCTPSTSLPPPTDSPNTVPWTSTCDDHLVNGLDCSMVPAVCSDQYGQLFCRKTCRGCTPATTVATTTTTATSPTTATTLKSTTTHAMPPAAEGDCSVPDHDECLLLGNVCEDSSLAHLLCPHTCGFCPEGPTTAATTATTTTAPSTTTSTTAHTSRPHSQPVHTSHSATPSTVATPLVEICVDYVGNGLMCQQLPNICFNPYGKLLCQNSCGFCKPTPDAVTPPPSTSSPSIGSCVDFVTNGKTCADIPDVCGSSYSQVICRSYCAYCTTSATPSTTTPVVETCLDFLGNGLNCQQLPSICFDPYGKIVCRNTCGFCHPTPGAVTSSPSTSSPSIGACLDFVTNGKTCAEIPDVCGSVYGQVICRSYCAFCITTTAPATTTTTGPTPTPTGPTPTRSLTTPTGSPATPTGPTPTASVVTGSPATGPTPTGAIPTGSKPTGSAATPTGPTPTGLIPTGLTPTGSTPAGSTPIGSTPTGPTSTGSTPTGSTPSDPSPTGSAETPTGPTPTGSTPTGPTPTEPTPTEPTPTGSEESPTGPTPTGSSPTGSTPTGSTPTGSTLTSTISLSTMPTPTMTVTTGARQCVDNVGNGVECGQLHNICQHPYAETLCPATCGSCVSSSITPTLPQTLESCADHIINHLTCGNLTEICHDMHLSPVICPLTCGFCVPGQPTSATPTITGSIASTISTIVTTVSDIILTTTTNSSSSSNNTPYYGTCVDRVGNGMQCADHDNVCQTYYATLLCPRYCGFCVPSYLESSTPNPNQYGTDTPDVCADRLVLDLRCTDMPSICQDSYASLHFCPKYCNICDQWNATTAQPTVAVTPNTTLASPTAEATTTVTTTAHMIGQCVDHIGHGTSCDKLAGTCADPLAPVVCAKTCGFCQCEDRVIGMTCQDIATYHGINPCEDALGHSVCQQFCGFC